MPRKIGDVIIACILLFGIFSGLYLFVDSADKTSAVNSGIRHDLELLKNDAKGANSLEVSFTDKIDKTGTFVVEEEIDLDSRGSDAAGEANINAKNIFTSFFSTLGETLNIPPIAITITLSCLGIIISILLLRVILGDNRI
ncbi:MAG TPA: hypothetical protein PLG47_05080 [Candidatus Dojkabacteria bacterium]|nr:hypothetical protein [Candidatus Dojkabacteria bacterium]